MKASISALTALAITSALIQAAPVDNSGSSNQILDWLQDIVQDDTTPAQQTAAVQTTAPTTFITKTSPSADPVPAPTETDTSDSSSGSGLSFNMDSLLSNQYVKSFLDYFGLDRGSSSSNADSAATVPTSTSAAPAPASTSSPAPAPASTSENNDPFSWFTFPGKKESSAAPAPTSTDTPTTSTPQYTPTTSTSLTAAAETSSDSDSGSSGVTGSDKQFAQDILDAHNKYRAIHGVSDLSWDEDAYQYAQNNADNYDCSGVLTHTHGQFGENLAAGFKTGPSAVKAWYDEGKTYNYQSPNSYDHFTQVVWKGSKGVGCAYKDCSKENWGLYVVCEYDRPGNVIGQRAANVLPPTSS